MAAAQRGDVVNTAELEDYQQVLPYCAHMLGKSVTINSANAAKLLNVEGDRIGRPMCPIDSLIGR